ncbi:MAG: dTDP-4-dehydrorhamnose 3,5-epimerase family protein [Actinomycetota bacterium]
MNDRMPHGVRLTKLETHDDDRGFLTEVFRSAWDTGIEPVQWNVTVSDHGVLRGVHVHLEHTDYIAVVDGWADVGLCDARPGSPTEALAVVVPLRSEEMAGLTIPPGVFHGLYLHERSIFLYGLSHGWEPADDLGCRWDDPEMGIPWPVDSPTLSDRDRTAPPFSRLLAEIGPALPAGPDGGSPGS